MSRSSRNKQQGFAKDGSSFWRYYNQVHSLLFSTFIDLPKAEILILHFLFLKSYRYGRIHAQLQPHDLIDGFDQEGLQGLGDLSERSRRRAKQNLIDQGLLIIQSRDVFLINFPEIIRRRPHLLGEDISKKLLDEWQLIFNSMNFEDRMTIDSALEQAKKNIERSKAKRLERLKKKQTWSVADVFNFMERFCEQEGIRYFEIRTRKLNGQVRNWLKEVEDPEEKLKEVILQWEHFYEFIYTEKGTLIFISPQVNFEQYYKFRREIDRWILMYAGRADRYSHIKVL